MQLFNDIIELSTSDRKEAWIQTAEKFELHSAMLAERDFWQCWVIYQLLAHEAFKDFPFKITKGSFINAKIYKTTNRINQDLDFAVWDNDWVHNQTLEEIAFWPKNQKSILIKTLWKIKSDFIENKLSVLLHEICRDTIKNAWKITLSQPHHAHLFFHYPTTFHDKDFQPFGLSSCIKIDLDILASYLPRLEMDHHSLSPYVSNAFQECDTVPQINLNCLPLKHEIWDDINAIHLLNTADITVLNPTTTSSPQKKLLLKLKAFYDLAYTLRHLNCSEHFLNSHALIETITLHQLALHYIDHSFTETFDDFKKKKIKLVPPLDRVNLFKPHYNTNIYVSHGEKIPFETALTLMSKAEKLIASS